MDTPNPQDRQSERSTFLAKWRHHEKTLERYAGLALIGAGALVLVWEQPGDQFTLLAFALSLATGFTLILRSGGKLRAYQSLHFLQSDQQSSRATFATVAAMFALYQGWNSHRPLWIVAGILLFSLSAWYRWRAQQIDTFDTLFRSREAIFSSDSSQSEE